MKPSRALASSGRRMMSIAADLDRAAGRPEDPAIIRKVVVFPGAVGAQESEQLAARHHEIDTVDRGELAVSFGELDQSDQAILRTMASTSSRSASRSTTMCSSDGAAGGLRRKRLDQKRRRLFHAQLTGTGSNQRGGDGPQLPVGRPLPGGNQGPADHLPADSGVRIPDDDVEHEGGREVPASGDDGGACLEGGRQASLLGKSRACVFVEPGHGRSDRAQALVRRTEDGVCLGQSPGHRR